MVFFFRKTDKRFLETLKDDYAEKHRDANNDGRLSWYEVKTGFRKLQSRWPAYRTQRTFHIADKDGDGYITEFEYWTSLLNMHWILTYWQSSIFMESQRY
ncbi:hypothetical protein Goari_009731, partial [Gossypium aridum]|nr:hypothetical protein [Gossypium aridum]